jgi:hypothetical protein
MNDSAIFLGNGSGVWRLPISELKASTSVTPQQQNPDRLLFSPLINVNGRRVTVAFSLSRSDRVIVSIYSLSGHQIATLVDTRLGPGSHSYSWNSGTVAAGCYEVKIRTGSNACVKRIPIIK